VDIQRAFGPGVNKDDLKGGKTRPGVQIITFPFGVRLSEVGEMSEKSFLFALPVHVHLAMAATALLLMKRVAEGIRQ
jgi:hypothetical protein